MELFTEYPEKDEQKYYELVAEQVIARMNKLYKDEKRAYRDTHAKSHACVKGNLEIFDFNDEAIKSQLAKTTQLTEQQINAVSIKQGLFGKPRQYTVLLRFANGRGEVKSQDYTPDTRSMSVKVIGVEGERLKQSHELNTQDIILQNAEIFFIKTIKDYYEFFRAVVESDKAVINWLLYHPRQLLSLLAITSRTPKSLLTESYWSGSAFALGLKPNFDPSQSGIVSVEYPAVIKYAFIPVLCQPPHKRMPYESRPGTPKIPFVNRAKAFGLDKSEQDNYYRDGLIRDLAKTNAQYCWDFGIQFQTSPSMSIDDVTIPWKESKSPFFTIGRLTVKHQIINFEKEFNFCENLRFSPWNGLVVHRPVGALNRLRSKIYPLVAEYRYQKLGIQYQEPTGEESFE